MGDYDHTMYIPTIGDEVTLIHPWTFSLYYESRNVDMMGFVTPQIGFKYGGTTINGKKVETGDKLCDVVLPVGAILKVDRIYIRKGAGMKDFDSVTFILQSIPNREIAVPRVRSAYVDDGVGKYGSHNYHYEKRTTMKKRLRFWAKLWDVNTMKFCKGAEIVEAEEPSIYRRIEL